MTQLYKINLKLSENQKDLSSAYQNSVKSLEESSENLNLVVLWRVFHPRAAGLHGGGDV